MDTHEINRLMQAEKRDARSERRFAAGLTGVLFGSISGLMLVVGLKGSMRDVTSTALGINDLIGIFVFCLITVLPFAVSYWCFRTTGSRSLWQVLGIGVVVSLVLTGAILAWFAVPVSMR